MSRYDPEATLKTITVGGKEIQYYVKVTRGNDQAALERFQRLIGYYGDIIEQKIAEREKNDNR